MKSIQKKINAKNAFGFSIFIFLFCIVYYMQEIPAWFDLKNFYRHEINQVAYDFKIEHPRTVRQLSDLRGYYLYLFFGFTHCSTICPKMMGTLHSLSKSIERPDIKFIFVSIDPIRDTKENLRHYGQAYGNRFVPVKLYKKDIKKVLYEYKSYVYNADLEKLKTQKDYQIDHTAFLYFINKEGMLKYIYTSRDLKVEDLKRDLQDLSSQSISIYMKARSMYSSGTHSLTAGPVQAEQMYKYTVSLKDMGLTLGSTKEQSFYHEYN